MLRSRDRRLNRRRPKSRWRGTALALAAAATAGLGAAALAPAVSARADIYRSTEMWVLQALDVQPAWTVTRGQGVVVAVIDSGVNPRVTDLAGSVITGPNFSGVNTSPSDPYWGVHGTWMASLIAGHGHGLGGADIDGSGIIGTAPAAKVLSIRVITDSRDPNHRRIRAGASQQGTARACRRDHVCRHAPCRGDQHVARLQRAEPAGAGGAPGCLRSQRRRRRVGGEFRRRRRAPTAPGTRRIHSLPTIRECSLSGR